MNFGFSKMLHFEQKYPFLLPLSLDLKREKSKSMAQEKLKQG